MRGALRVGPGFSLEDLDPRSTPGFTGTKEDAEEAMPDIQRQLGSLQERLFAQSREGAERSVLLMVQGMDTSGKGGIMRHVVGALDPQGVHYHAFKAPTKEELSHHFLWRVTKALPGPGLVGVFDRSQYEDVLIVRVHNLVPGDAWSGRYDEINAWEEDIVESGTQMVKVMLHISHEEQRSRLGERLDRPDKYWKFNPGDIDERAHWAAYMTAYQAALEKCSTEVAPWYVVPADRKWFARYAVSRLLLETLEAMNPTWPPAAFDIDEQRRRLAAT